MGDDMFRLRHFEEKDSDAVTAIVFTLEKFYPTISEWWNGRPDKPGELQKLQTGIDYCLLAVSDDEIAGVSIFGKEKDSAMKTIKLKTFLVTDKFQSQGIGPFLFEETMKLILAQKPEKIFVTFNEAEAEEVGHFFTKYGFQLEAAVLGEYLPGKVEFHLSKLQEYGVLGEGGFADFVKRKYLQNRGFIIKPGDGATLAVENLAEVPGSEPTTVRFELNQNPVFEKADDTLYFSFYSPDRQPVGITVIDGHDIENLFYPLVLNRRADAGFIAPVNPVFAKQLFPDVAQVALEPLKHSLRSDKVFFKSLHVKQGIKRGATFIFYETSPMKKIVGEARVSKVEIGDASELYAQYKRKGVVTEKELQEWGSPSTGEIQVIFMDRWLKYFRPLDEPAIKRVIPSFNAQGTQALTHEQLQGIRKAAGYYA